MRSLSLISLTVLLALTNLATAQAATRTWVSGVGDDMNPCSRTSPCKTFAGAISKTDPGGEINVLDPGAYGGVTITKSIAIISELPAGVLVSGSNGIIVNAGVNDVVDLRGLNIDGLGTGLGGVKIFSARVVNISKCLIRNFRGAGGGGVLVVPTTAKVQVLVSESTLSNNKNGILNTPTAPGEALVVVDRSIIKNNEAQGLRTNAATGKFRLSNSVITGNAPGLSVANGGTIVSFGNNIITDNTPDGAPTSTLPPL